MKTLPKQVHHTVLVVPLCLLACAPSLLAHPVPQSNHDRIMVVRVTAVALIVDFRLETSESNIILELPREETATVAPRSM